jgi:hypothetical protein
MGIYSKEIIQCENGYLIKNYKISKVIFFYIMQLVICFLVFIYVGQIIYDIKNNRIECIITLVFSIIFFLVGFKAFNDIKKIFINTTDNEIIFKNGLFPFIKIKILKINNVKEISINHKSNRYATSGISTYTFKYIMKEYIFNIDIIDYECSAYRIYQSTAYNDELIGFSKEIGKIINININDQNDIEGKDNIYKKIIIN